MGVRDRIASSITDIQNRGKRLVELNVELITAELKRKGQQYGAAVGLFVGAGVLALYGFGFLLATIAVALYIVLPLWLSLLIVTAALFLIVLILALIGRSRLQAAQKPATVKPADEARKSLDLAKGQLQETARSVVPKRSSVTIARPGASEGGPSWSPPPPPGSSGPLSTPSSGTSPSRPTMPPSPTGPTGPAASPPAATPPSPPAGESTSSLGEPPVPPDETPPSPGTPPSSPGGE